MLTKLRLFVKENMEIFCMTVGNIFLTGAIVVFLASFNNGNPYPLLLAIALFLFIIAMVLYGVAADRFLKKERDAQATRLRDQ